MGVKAKIQEGSGRYRPTDRQAARRAHYTYSVRVMEWTGTKFVFRGDSSANGLAEWAHQLLVKKVLSGKVGRGVDVCCEEPIFVVKDRVTLP